MKLGRGARRRGRETAAGGCARIGTWAAPGPRHVQGALAGAPKTTLSLARTSSLGEGAPRCVRCARPPGQRRGLSALPPNRLGLLVSEGGKLGSFRPEDPPNTPTPTRAWICTLAPGHPSLSWGPVESSTDYTKATLSTSPASPVHHSNGLGPDHLGFKSLHVLTVYSLQSPSTCEISFDLPSSPVRWAWPGKAIYPGFKMRNGENEVQR